MLEIRKTNKSYRFVVKSSQGQPLLESVDFTNPKDLESCIDGIRTRLGNPGCFERRTVHSGQFQFSLKDGSGRIVGKSALYRSEAGMENGIKNTRSGLLESDGT